MKRSAVLAALALTLFVAACDDDDDEGETFAAGPLSGANESPTNNSTATGNATFTFLNGVMTYTLNVSGLSGTLSGAHIHGPAAVGANAGVIVPLNVGANQTFTATTSTTIDMDSLLVLMRNGMSYVNVHSTPTFGAGEIRAQIRPTN